MPNLSGHKLFLLAALVALGIFPDETLCAEGFVTREEAMAAAFPNAKIQSETIFLTEAQRREVAALSEVECPTSMIARYSAMENGRVVGRAYVDTHTVRTKKESLLIILDADGILKRIEVTASLESPEFQAPQVWYQQYEGKSLSDDLRVDRAIRPLAGATLTARAANQAVRRILAIDRVLTRKIKDPP